MKKLFMAKKYLYALILCIFSVFAKQSYAISFSEIIDEVTRDEFAQEWVRANFLSEIKWSSQESGSGDKKTGVLKIGDFGNSKIAFNYKNNTLDSIGIHVQGLNSRLERGEVPSFDTKKFLVEKVKLGSKVRVISENCRVPGIGMTSIYEILTKSKRKVTIIFFDDPGGSGVDTDSFDISIYFSESNDRYASECEGETFSANGAVEAKDLYSIFNKASGTPGVQVFDGVLIDKMARYYFRASKGFEYKFELESNDQNMRFSISRSEGYLSESGNVVPDSYLSSATRKAALEFPTAGIYFLEVFGGKGDFKVKHSIESLGEKLAEPDVVSESPENIKYIIYLSGVGIALVFGVAIFVFIKISKSKISPKISIENECESLDLVLNTPPAAKISGPVIYQVVIVGLGDNEDERISKYRLSVLLKKTPEQLTAILANKRYVIKTGLDHFSLQEYKEKIEKTGYLAEIEVQNCNLTTVVKG